MIIGIDLDNTIIDYRLAFWKTALATGILTATDKNSFNNEEGPAPSKNEIKSRLFCSESGKYQWESLQGQVYGRYIHNATIYSGVANFLLHCKRRRVKVYIISHKTEFGHHDKSKTPLRRAALNFLKQNSFLSKDFGIENKDIFFFGTRQEKVIKVAELKCDYFIDDLPEVFLEPNFPEGTRKILFDIKSEYANYNSAKSWQKINEFVFGHIEEADIAAYVEIGVNKKIKTVQRIEGRGNSRLYKIEMDSGHEYAGKLYPDPTFDDRNRLLKETKAYKFLHSNEFKTVPENIWFDTNLNFGLFEWVNGTEINKVTDSNLIGAVAFVDSLAKLSKHTSNKEFQLASAACLSGQMIEDQIQNRYKTIREFSVSKAKLHRFLEIDFLNTFEEILSESKKNWPTEFKTDLLADYQLLSPSDFGFHNAILTKDGLKFIDFEYFGWDDPVKLTCDFLLHPGMMLTDKQKNLWLNKVEDVFNNDNTFHRRLLASYSLYGLCWCLIMLNVFITDNHGKKIIEEVENNDLEEKQTKQFERSKKLLEHINNVNRQGLPFE